MSTCPFIILSHDEEKGRVKDVLSGCIVLRAMLRVMSGIIPNAAVMTLRPGTATNDADGLASAPSSKPCPRRKNYTAAEGDLENHPILSRGH